MILFMPLLDNFVYSLDQFSQQFSDYWNNKTPFFIMIDFEMNLPVIIPTVKIPGSELGFSFHGAGNLLIGFSEDSAKNKSGPITQADALHCKVLDPPDFQDYATGFERIQRGLERGNSFLANYTTRTRVGLNASLDHILQRSRARYLLRVKNQKLGDFLVFSPEIFVQIRKNQVFTYPMKGTATATDEISKSQLLENKKELAEHLTVVDLLRNDLGQIATKVSVPKYRYLERIKTSNQDLWQMSSEIIADLDPKYEKDMGGAFLRLLPAGSISGAPKKKTCEIIAEAEGRARGFYTGVAGYFNGYSFDSCVLIRFIEEVDNEFYFRSGGGITIYSELEDEYQEVLDKIYLPTR
jgi:para-aminobenzoate synthetase component 1